MKCAQFIYGQFNGRTLRSYQSPNLDSILRTESITWLMQLGKHIKKYTERTNIFPTEQAVAYSFLYPTVDDGRKSMWNHTIVIKFDSVFEELKHVISKHHVSPKRTLNFLMSLNVELE